MKTNAAQTAGEVREAPNPQVRKCNVRITPCAHHVSKQSMEMVGANQEKGGREVAQTTRQPPANSGAEYVATSSRHATPTARNRPAKGEAMEALQLLSKQNTVTVRHR